MYCWERQAEVIIEILGRLAGVGYNSGSGPFSRA
jgi:hypothetical protein